jgi:predicted enzyme related to lactoylglutathione lyase
MSQDERLNRIDYVEIPAPDVERAKAFYAEVFGWGLQDYGSEYCCFQDGRLDGAFAAARKVAENGPLIVIYVADIEATMAKILAAGGEQTVPKFKFPGGHRAHFKDPSGNELSIWSDAEV